MKNIMTYATTLILSFFLCTSAFADMAIFSDGKFFQSDEQIFIERLQNYLNALKNVPEKTSLESKELLLATKNANKLWSFTDAFPNSKYASNARCVIIMNCFFGALGSKDKKDSEKLIKDMEYLTKRYPNNKFEQVTVGMLKNSPHSLNVFKYMSMSNTDLLIYFRAMAGLTFNDYESALKYYLLLKNRIGSIKNLSSLVISEIYAGLVISYDNLGNTSAELETAKEALSKFPDNAWLKQHMEKIIQQKSNHSE